MSQRKSSDHTSQLPEAVTPESPEPAAPVEGGAPPPPSTLGRRGQIEAEKARFDLGPQQRVLVDALGELPPGYGLTFVRAWVRDPRYLVAVWDINAEHELTLGEERGWQTVVLRLLSDAGETLRQIPVAKRNGIWHLAVGQHEGPLRIALGFATEGKFETIARSNAVRMPPLEPDRELAGETLSLPPRFDRRLLVRAEPPPRPGYQRRGLESAAWRLDQRIMRARRTPEARRSEQPFRSEPSSTTPSAQNPPPEPNEPAGPDRAVHANPPPPESVELVTTKTSAPELAGSAQVAPSRRAPRMVSLPQPPRPAAPVAPTPSSPDERVESAPPNGPTRSWNRRFGESKTPPRDVSSPRGGFSRERRDD
jgi:hypothetical protein